MLAAISRDGKTMTVVDRKEIKVSGNSAQLPWGTVSLWDLAAGRPRTELVARATRFSQPAFSRDGKTLAIPDERSVRLWDVATERWRPGELCLPDKVKCLAFAPDGRSLASGDFGGGVRLWDLEAGREVWLARAQDGVVTSLEFSGDGRALVSASYHDRVARVWDAASGCRVAELSGHNGSVQSLAVAPVGTVAATVTADGTVCLWDRTSGRRLDVLKGDGFGRWLLAFSPDGRVLAAACSESSVVSWNIGVPPSRSK
jgi:WD40 repeat protein